MPPPSDSKLLNNINNQLELNSSNLQLLHPKEFLKLSPTSIIFTKTRFLKKTSRKLLREALLLFKEDKKIKEFSRLKFKVLKNCSVERVILILLQAQMEAPLPLLRPPVLLLPLWRNVKKIWPKFKRKIKPLPSKLNPSPPKTLLIIPNSNRKSRILNLN